MIYIVHIVIHTILMGQGDIEIEHICWKWGDITENEEQYITEKEAQSMYKTSR